MSEVKSKLVTPSGFEHIYACFLIANAPKNLRTFEEMEHRLIQVSGFDMEKLIDLFAAGYTLQPPKKNLSLEEMGMSWLDGSV